MNHTPTSAAIIAGAGMGHRLGADIPKALIQIDGVTLIERAFAALSPVVDEIVITAPAGYEDQFRAIVGDSATVITGGVLRSDSVNVALKSLSPSTKYVLVHDAARALATSELAQRVLHGLTSGESAVIPALSVVDTIKEVDRDGYVRSTPDRSILRAVQTPQGFSVDVLKRAHEASEDATDDAALVEALGVKVKTIPGEARAMKITNPEDIAMAVTLVRDLDSNMRVGVGTDAHAFSSDASRQLWLAGIHWPDVVGVDGHSDGDVAAHAICDALFSATGLGDLGSNFGVSDPQYSGASGATLLAETFTRINKAGYAIKNVAVQIVCNKPKIGPRRAEAISALSKALGGAPVSVTATSTDGLGFTGEGKGISAIATALVARKK
ncbi:MAG: 2-C-methyl-D-erythritol 4-phosphate cytidylyltransferase [Candidatus Nanopelagicaceae bacterium]|jgi:2-C-methyl-D-erythritol 4-phosphate cytidylyltransferase/2-C-methyl-D-erythritol 2,4-cyclodiphosphate synthase